MKNFTQFFTEARETSASAEAKRLGLTGDGHGGWYDKNGEFVAKTVQGKLKFFGSDNTPGQKDSPSQPTAQASAQPAVTQAPVAEPQPTQQVAAVPADQTAQQEVPPEQQPAEVPVPETPGVVVVFGRFNPPTIGHQKLLKFALSGHTATVHTFI